MVEAPAERIYEPIQLDLHPCDSFQNTLKVEKS